MTSRRRRDTTPNPAVFVFCVCVLGALGALRVESRQEKPAADITQRVAERLSALRREADLLASQEKSILNELRKLEIERQIKAEELTAVERDLAATAQQLARTTSRAAALRESADVQRPEVEDRLVRLYKMGRAGYWRLLLDVDDVRSLGRAYRTAAALTALDRNRIRQHGQTLESLEREQRELRARAAEAASLKEKAAAARAALDRAVASRQVLVASIVSRRDVASQLAAELDAAHLRLQSILAQDPAARPPAFTVPLRPFQGDLPWPAEGIVVRRFRRQPAAAAGIAFSRNGIEISLAEGRTVSAIHDGVVTHAGPFTGYGHLVIVDHGGGAVSVYGHLASATVNKGDRVGAGSAVGLSGRNPGSNPSLYFELRVDGKPVDPLQWLRRGP
jgi:septal ring factor EnvC (AmiA/AmiB activator)